MMSAESMRAAQSGGSRVTAVTSDRHAARLVFRRVSEPSAESERLSAAPVVRATVHRTSCYECRGFRSYTMEHRPTGGCRHQGPVRHELNVGMADIASRRVLFAGEPGRPFNLSGRRSAGPA